MSISGDTHGGLHRNASYSWDELGEIFQCKPNYFSTGGMLSRPHLGILILITHPHGGVSFDYKDHKEGNDLVYTGMGLVGDQKKQGQNCDVAENRKRLFVFQGDEPKHLEFLGEAFCKEWWWGQGIDKAGNMRKTIHFRLNFL